MIDKQFLLTYIKEGKEGFDWFENVQDMEISIIERGIKKAEINDMIKIDSCENITLSHECIMLMENN